MKKFCIDCGHYSLNTGIAICNRPNEDIDLITGKPKPLYCAVEREFDSISGICGYQGKHFKAKEEIGNE